MTDYAALANPMTRLLDKDRRDFTRADMLRLVREQAIERLTFHYTGLDGKLRELRLPFTDYDQAERILAAGERVDGSSLFKGLVDASSSDLYVVPSYATAFLSPFDPQSLDFICRFLDRDGNLASFTPDNVLAIAHRRFHDRTGLELHALGELEFFLIREGGPENYSGQRQMGRIGTGRPQQSIHLQQHPPHLPGIGSECADMTVLHGLIPRPEPILTPEVGNAAFHRNPGTRQRHR